MTNDDTHRPLYQRIAEVFRSHILQGQWQPGAVIPTETELCQQFSASRATIRKALDALTLEGVISRRAGKGTWVTETKRQDGFWYSYQSDYPFPESVTVEILASESVVSPASGDVFSHFGSERILTRIKVLRSLNDTPLALSEIFLRPEDAEKVIAAFDPERDIYFFDILERMAGVQVDEVHETFDAVLAVGEVAERLHVMASSPLTLITRVFFGKGQRVIQASRVYLRPDVNKLKIIRKKRQ
jgi:GntR family transcriptional regulator